MISQSDLEQAIAECLGTRNPDVNTCLKLSAFYTIKDHLFPPPKETDFSFSPPAVVSEAYVDYQGKSEFMQAVDGRPASEAWAIIDELMDTLAVIYPRLYEGVMRKLL